MTRVEGLKYLELPLGTGPYTFIRMRKFLIFARVEKELTVIVNKNNVGESG